MFMRRNQVTLAAMLGIGLLTAGCATSQSVSDKEARLVAAGFEKRQADTPKRQAMLARLPPNQLVQRPWKGGMVFVYADPAGCNCAYLGNQAALDRYKQSSPGRQESVMASEGAESDMEPWGMAGWRS